MLHQPIKPFVKTRLLVFLTLLQLSGFHYCKAQQNPDSLLTMGNKLEQQYISVVSKKSEKLSGAMDKQTEKYLAKLEKQEAGLKKKLSKIDSLAANKIFADAKQQYQDIQNKVKTKSTALLNKTHQYVPWLDSASTSLKFLDKNPLIGNINGNAAKFTGALSKVKELENQFKQAASVKDFIQQRKAYLKEQLQNYSLGSDLKKYNQTAYYYSQQMNDYRQALNDPDKAEKKALELLNKLPAFQSFMKKNSMLASLFAVPGGEADIASAAGLQGLQTRAGVQQLIQNQLAAGGPNAQGMFQQNMQEAQGYLTSLKNKVSQLGSSGGTDADMPDFKPNAQKTKTFLKRLEYGANMQSVKSNYYFPTTTDIAFSVGYKLNTTNLIGIGASYKMGWGKDIKHIALSSEGIGFRSFLDMKLKGSFYASGGIEYQYQQPVGSWEQVKYLNVWQQSGLIGLSKVVSLKTKVFKKTKLQLLWDFLSYRQRPVGQAFKIRVGYSF